MLIWSIYEYMGYEWDKYTWLDFYWYVHYVYDMILNAHFFESKWHEQPGILVKSMIARIDDSIIARATSAGDLLD